MNVDSMVIHISAIFLLLPKTPPVSQGQKQNLQPEIKPMPNG